MKNQKVVGREYRIHFRNPIEFVNQWAWKGFRKWKYLSLWVFHAWRDNVCGIWIDYGLRIMGIEFCCRAFLARKSKKIKGGENARTLDNQV